jgi:hypothetical protein
MEKDIKNSKKDLPLLNTLLVAFVAITIVQISHEATHAIVSILLGANLEVFHLMGIGHGWPSGVATDWKSLADALIAGSAALLNITVGIISLLLFYRKRLQDKPYLRLFIFYVAAYSWLMGFGYLFIDPIYANSESAGDWAKVVMFLGGGWEIRVPLIIIGALGLVYSYFWMGKAGMHFTFGDMKDKETRTKTGRTLLIYPYVVVNIIYTLFAFLHPLGFQGLFIIIMQVWMGYSGFFWAFMINYIWSDYKGPFEKETALPDSKLNKNWLILGIIAATFSFLLLTIPLILWG